MRRRSGTENNTVTQRFDCDGATVQLCELGAKARTWNEDARTNGGALRPMEARPPQRPCSPHVSARGEVIVVVRRAPRSTADERTNEAAVEREH